MRQAALPQGPRLLGNLSITVFCLCAENWLKPRVWTCQGLGGWGLGHPGLGFSLLPWISGLESVWPGIQDEQPSRGALIPPSPTPPGLAQQGGFRAQKGEG